MPLRRVILAAALAGVSACSVRTLSCRLMPAEPPPNPMAVAMPVSPNEVSDAHKVAIAFLGDSLAAGLGLPTEQAFPSRIEQMFVNEGYGEIQAIDAGVSGDTTAGGLRRIDDVLQPNVKILVVALGGNDALRGLSAVQTHDNIAAIIDRALAHGTDVLLAGMEAPTNLGQDYQVAFHNAFDQLARQYAGRIAYVPFLLEGVAGIPSLNQEDGIHPNAAGAEKVAELLYPPLRNMVDRLPPAGAS